MANAPLDVNWEAIRAHAVIHGVRATAADYGIAPGTLTARSCREGWFKGEQSVAILPQRPKQSNAVKPVEAAVNGLERYSSKSRIRLAKAGYKAATELSRMKGREVLDRCHQFKAIVDGEDKLHQWSKESAVSPISIYVGPAAPAAPTIDISVEKL